MLKLWLSSVVFVMGASVQAQVCDIESFSDRFREAMAKNRKPGGAVYTEKSMSGAVKTVDLDKDIRLSRQDLAKYELQKSQSMAQTTRSGLANRLNSRAEYHGKNGNYLESQKDFREAGDLFAKNAGSKKGSVSSSGYIDDRNVSGAVENYTRSGDISRAADMIDPNGYGSFVTGLQDTEEIWRRGANLKGHEKLNHLRYVYHRFRLQAEVGTRAKARGTSSGVETLANRAGKLSAEVKNQMEELVAQLPP